MGGVELNPDRDSEPRLTIEYTLTSQSASTYNKDTLAWNTRLESLSADNYNYLGVFDSVATGVPTGGGANIACPNSTVMGFILDLPPGGTIRQTAKASQVFNGGGYASISASFSNPVDPSSVVIAVVSGIFQSSLFNLSCQDGVGNPLTGPYPDGGHVPGESNTLQVFIGGGGDPGITVTQYGLSPFTSPNLIIMEYAGLSGVITSHPSAFVISLPSLTIGNATTSANDLLLMAIGIIQACPNPNVQPFGGGNVATPPGPGNRIPPNSLPVISLPFCFDSKCRIFV